MKSGKLLKTVIGIAASVFALNTIAENTVIKNPEFFKSPLREGFANFPDTLYFDTDAEEITFPDMGTFVHLGDYNFPNLRKVTLGNVDYMPGNSFSKMPKLEEVVINGLVGHFDCYFVSRCPNLRKIIFRGPVSGTGGPMFVYQCPKFDTLIFESSVCELGLNIYPQQQEAPLNKIIVNGALLQAYKDSLTPVTDIAFLKKNKKKNKKVIADLETLAQWQRQVLLTPGSKNGDIDGIRDCVYNDAKLLLPALTQLGSREATPLKEAMEYAWNNGDDVKTKLEILKQSPAYKTDASKTVKFSYALPSDSLLTLSRERFNLDSIAGNGDDISKIKNLLYWVHNNITHDGLNGIPAGPRNMRNIYDSARRDSCGVNCRGLAICLTEALLAEGIPSRYITCLPKHWDTDNDCHVICIAWSESLGKWIWVDPTFAAYVTDENGVLLHPGEVRYRLQNDMPLILNEDANWNNRVKYDKEEYLDEYMAKNLYLLEANTINQSEPEGKSNHQKGEFVTLAPEGVDYRSNIIINDESIFWQKPE